jgi:hypothetical protein
MTDTYYDRYLYRLRDRSLLEEDGEINHYIHYSTSRYRTEYSYGTLQTCSG